MTNIQVKTYETYLSAWSDVTDDERSRLLRESLSEDAVLLNPLQSRRGHLDIAAHLRAFQQRVAGGSARLIEMLGWDKHAHASWELLDAQGRPVLLGYDVLAFDGEGRISSVLLFSRVEKQILRASPAA